MSFTISHLYCIDAGAAALSAYVALLAGRRRDSGLFALVALGALAIGCSQ